MSDDSGDEERVLAAIGPIRRTQATTPPLQNVFTEPNAGGKEKAGRSQRINWCFTINNYDEQDERLLCDLDKMKAKYICYGKEVGEQGTPHLQGYIQFKNRQRFTSAKKLFNNLGVHLEIARGSDQQNYDYCKKSCLANEFYEFGERLAVGSNKRKIGEIVDYMLANPKKDADDFYNQFGESYLNHYKKARENFVAISNARHSKTLFDKNEVKLYDWQVEAFAKLYDQDDRKILFIVDIEGNKGKTYFAKWLVWKHNAVYFTGTANKDCAYAWNYEKYIVFDLARCLLDHINYGTIEQFKNGIIFSTKYESKCKIAKDTKVIVLMNEHPDMLKLSADRYDIINI